MRPVVDRNVVMRRIPVCPFCDVQAKLGQCPGRWKWPLEPLRKILLRIYVPVEEDVKWRIRHGNEICVYTWCMNVYMSQHVLHWEDWNGLGMSVGWIDDEHQGNS